MPTKTDDHTYGLWTIIATVEVEALSEDQALDEFHSSVPLDGDYFYDAKGIKVLGQAFPSPKDFYNVIETLEKTKEELSAVKQELEKERR